MSVFVNFHLQAYKQNAHARTHTHTTTCTRMHARTHIHIHICTYTQCWWSACEHDRQCSEDDPPPNGYHSQHAGREVSAPGKKQNQQTITSLKCTTFFPPQNRSKALRVLRARVYELRRRTVEEERSQNRRKQIGSLERSERIRTYNFHQVSSLSRAVFGVDACDQQYWKGMLCFGSCCTYSYICPIQPGRLLFRKLYI